MSRSFNDGKRKKGCGYEFWPRRNYKTLTDPSSENKTLPRRFERRKAKQELK